MLLDNFITSRIVPSAVNSPYNDAARSIRKSRDCFGKIFVVVRGQVLCCTFLRGSFEVKEQRLGFSIVYEFVESVASAFTQALEEFVCACHGV